MVGDEIRRAARRWCIYSVEIYPQGAPLIAYWLDWSTVGSLSDITEPVVARAVAQVPYPAAQFDPQVDDPWTYVNFPTSVWVEDWEVRSASDTQFGITVTVTVVPDGFSWDPGDGTAAVGCGQAARSGQCTHVYGRSTQRLDSTVTQEWTINIDRTLGGDEVRPLVLASPYQVRVAEIQTVVES